ncbi:metacaspase-1 [Phtheirospermum japonicum]|uniref:Metacaspase-1 n=1 Tax=Phtheirospermum japonicum TaxID=374723 RepID=A0A830CUL1_9LAMI|nr:metacaspase-1 [Phtheirospermum japonicum]
MASKRVQCNSCGMQITVAPKTHAIIQCPICQTITHIIQPNDPSNTARNSIQHMASKCQDLFNKASSNINTMIATRNSQSGSFIGYRPQKAIISPSLVAGSAHGKKRAVLCGVSYYGQRHRLNGTVNDVKCMRFFLNQKFGFPNDSILVLTEGASDPSLIPTKNNMRRALQWLVHGCQTGDSLVFHYSGHGSQSQEFNGDEVDGHDEMLWPVDHEREGRILDDEINATIVRPLPRGAKLHAIIDACHSGTILDLPFVCRMNRDGFYMWEDQGQLSSIYKGTSGGLAVSISACDDHQVSWDTTAFSGNTPTGAMTFSFIQAVQNEPGLTYGRLLNAMRQKIRDTKTGPLPNGPVTSLLKKVLKIPPQEPQLSSSDKFEIYTTEFCLPLTRGEYVIESKDSVFLKSQRPFLVSQHSHRHLIEHLSGIMARPPLSVNLKSLSPQFYHYHNHNSLTTPQKYFNQ